MLVIALLMTGAVVIQTVRVIQPSPAEIAAARLPVPDVVMTLAEADTLSDAALTARLIGHVPHGPIVKVARQRIDPSPMSEGDNALSSVTFVERGTPLRGRLCRGRSIAVTFDTVDGKGEPRALPTPAASRPRRVFAVTQNALLAVVPRAASAESCARAGFTGGGRADFDELAVIVERLVAASEGKDVGVAGVSCFDRFGASGTACDTLGVLRTLDWSQLGTIHRDRLNPGPPRWTMSVGQGGRAWNLTMVEAGGTANLTLRRDYPAPF